jgi:hypothetical protein
MTRIERIRRIREAKAARRISLEEWMKLSSTPNDDFMSSALDDRRAAIFHKGNVEKIGPWLHECRKRNVKEIILEARHNVTGDIIVKRIRL